MAKSGEKQDIKRWIRPEVFLTCYQQKDICAFLCEFGPNEGLVCGLPVKEAKEQRTDNRCPSDRNKKGGIVDYLKYGRFVFPSEKRLLSRLEERRLVVDNISAPTEKIDFILQKERRLVVDNISAPIKKMDFILQKEYN